MQADSEYIYKSWIQALQQGIGAAIQHSDQSTNYPGKSQITNDFNSLNNYLSSNLNKIKKSK